MILAIKMLMESFPALSNLSQVLLIIGTRVGVTIRQDTAEYETTCRHDLYPNGHWRSGSLAVEMALAEIGVDYQVRELTWRPKPSVTIIMRR